MMLSGLKTGQHQKGATLVELIVSIVVLSVSVMGIMVVVARTTSSIADPMIRTQAIAISQAYMEEILSQTLTDPAGGDTNSCETGESRGTYDDVTDYNCISNQAVQDQQGNPITPLNGYKVTVSVASTTLNGSAARRILVTVTYDGVAGFSLPVAAYRLN